MRSLPIIIAATTAALLGALGAANAASIIDEWGSVKPEAAPELKPVTIDAKTTALIVMDLVKGSCNNERRPRCVTNIPAVAKLMSEAREKNVLLINTVAGSGGVPDILPEVAPKSGEPILTKTVADKFVNTDLEKMLKDKGITTLITVGTAAQGAVLYTASDAAFRGFKVIVPVETSTSESLYAEQAVAWLLTHAPGVATQTTLTSVDKMKF